VSLVECVVYGGSSGTEAEVVYFEAFKEKYAGIASTQQGWKYTVLGCGFLTTEYGLKYYWPNTKQMRSGYITNSEAICNYPVQGLATAEIIPIAVGHLWRNMRRHRMVSFITNTVHDSVIAEVCPEEIELFTELAVQAFTTAVYEYLYDMYGMKFFVPLGAGVKIGTHWGEGVETTYEPECPYNLEEIA